MNSDNKKSRTLTEEFEALRDSPIGNTVEDVSIRARDGASQLFTKTKSTIESAVTTAKSVDSVEDAFTKAANVIGEGTIPVIKDTAHNLKDKFSGLFTRK